MEKHDVDQELRKNASLIGSGTIKLEVPKIITYREKKLFNRVKELELERIELQSKYQIICKRNTEVEKDNMSLVVANSFDVTDAIINAINEAEIVYGYNEIDVTIPFKNNGRPYTLFFETSINVWEENKSLEQSREVVFNDYNWGIIIHCDESGEIMDSTHNKEKWNEFEEMYKRNFFNN